MGGVPFGLASLLDLAPAHNAATHIGYGIGHDVTHNDEAALDKLRKLARQYDRLTVAHVPGPDAAT